MPYPTAVVERFLATVGKNGPVSDHRPDLGPCWLWLKGIDSSNGYARFRLEWAHRVSYKIHVGAIPEGLTIDHLCRVRHCVNPAHLEAVTRVENILRGTGWSGRNAQKTHCVHGHEFTPENTYLEPQWKGRGSGVMRRCKTCNRDKRLRYYHARKAAA